MLLAACSSAPTKSSDAPTTISSVKMQMPGETVDVVRESAIKTTELAAPSNKVWSALMQTHALIELNAVSTDSAAGSAVYRRGGVRSLLSKPISTYIDCGRGAGGVARAETYSVTVQVDEKVVKTDDTRSQLMTVVAATARDRAMSNTTVECTSNGTLERQIAGMVMTRVQ